MSLEHIFLEELPDAFTDFVVDGINEMGREWTHPVLLHSDTLIPRDSIFLADLMNCEFSSSLLLLGGF